MRLVHVIASFLLMHTYAQKQEVPPPLPAANSDLVNHYRLALEAVFGVGIRLQAFLQNDQNENFLVSPISATVILGQLILGAEGEFRKQLVELLALPNSDHYENFSLNYHEKNITYSLPYSLLHLQLSNLLKALEGPPNDAKHFILKQKSAVFVDNSITLNNTFKKYLFDFYRSRIRVLDFQGNPGGSQSSINSWVTKNTNGLIKSILSEPPSPTTISIFANAIYFKAEWEMPFSDTLNREGLFNVTASKQVPVTYMINYFEQILYSEAPEFRLIGLPYTKEELGMYLILPRPDSPYKYDVKNFVQNLKSREILETIAKARRKDVVVKIPKMTLSNSYSILNQLKKYRAFKKQNIKLNATNVVDKLDERVDAYNNFTKIDENDIFLNNAALDKKLRVDDIVQQVVITINEKGTEAAAVSASTIDYMGGSKNFIIDRPFVFFIRHEATSVTLFWGTVSNPTH